MKYLVPSAVSGSVVGLLIAKFLGRDYTIVAASVAGALSYLLIIYSLWPLLYGKDRKRKSILAPGLLGIAIFSTILFTYAPLNILLGRPSWVLEGIPFYIYIGSYGGLIGSIGTHLVQIGQTQGRTMQYLFMLALFVVTGLGTALALYMFDFEV